MEDDASKVSPWNLTCRRYSEIRTWNNARSDVKWIIDDILKMSAWRRTWQLCSTIDKTKYASLKLNWAEGKHCYSKLIPLILPKEKSIRPKTDKMNMKGNLHLQPSKITENNSKDDYILNETLITRLGEDNL